VPVKKLQQTQIWQLGAQLTCFVEHDSVTEDGPNLAQLLKTKKVSHLSVNIRCHNIELRHREKARLIIISSYNMIYARCC
jgi:hypothetical protein